MSGEILHAAQEFIKAFEAVFDDDWKHTQEMLGIETLSREQEAAAAAMGLERIDIIHPAGTFLKPAIEDEIEDWGNRGLLLQKYRQLKKLISNS